MLQIFRFDIILLSLYRRPSYMILTLSDKIILFHARLIQMQYPVNYVYAQRFTQDILLGGTLGNELNALVNATNGVVSGGLGSKINLSFNIQANFVRSFYEEFNMKVPAYTHLTLCSYIRGYRVSGYAKNFFSWIEIKRGQYELKIPSYQIYTPILN